MREPRINFLKLAYKVRSESDYTWQSKCQKTMSANDSYVFWHRCFLYCEGISAFPNYWGSGNFRIIFLLCTGLKRVWFNQSFFVYWSPIQKFIVSWTVCMCTNESTKKSLQVNRYRRDWPHLSPIKILDLGSGPIPKGKMWTEYQYTLAGQNCLRK